MFRRTASLIASVRSQGCSWQCSSRWASYLSEAFSGQAAWSSMLKSPLLQKVNMNTYFFEIDRKFQREGRGTPADVDIFAMACAAFNVSEYADDWEMLKQLEEVLRRFRGTAETNLMLPSTQHSVVRAFVAHEDTDSLMRILLNPINFGVFLDDYSLVFLLHHFLQKENYRDASKVAMLMMYQEEWEIPLASQMGLFATYQYIKMLPDENGIWDPQPAPVPEEPEEEVKIRVDFLESPYQDGHFDLTVREHLLGKTLAKLAELGPLRLNTDQQAVIIRKSLQLVGWSLFEKWDKVRQLANTKPDVPVVKECLDLLLQRPHDSAEGEAAVAAVSGLPTTTLDVSGYLEQAVKDSAGQHEASYIAKLESNLTKWKGGLEAELQNHYLQYEREQKLLELERTKQELREEEEHLFFFDKYPTMEREKFQKFVAWRKTWPSKSWGKPIKMPKKKVDIQ